MVNLLKSHDWSMNPVLKEKYIELLRQYYYVCGMPEVMRSFIQKGSRIIPIEVKAEENVQAKSLRYFILANPSLKGLRFSMADSQEQDWMTNIPLYAMSEMACVSSRK